MNRTWKSIHAVFLAGMFVFTLGLAACSDDDSTTSVSTDSSAQQTANARTDAELQALADAAATASGLSSFDSVTTGNAGDLGNSGDDTSDSTGFLTAPSGSFVNSRLTKAFRKSKRELRGAANQLATNRGGSERYATTLDFTTTYSDQVVNCNSGQVTINGTVVFVLDVPDENNATLTRGAEDLTLDFDACSDGSYTLWGSTLANADDVMSISLSSDGDSGTFSMSFDDYEDGGLVLQEDSSSTAYNYIFRFVFVATASGTYVASSDTTTFDTLTFAAEVTLNDVTCTTSGSSEADTENPTWTCTSS